MPSYFVLTYILEGSIVVLELYISSHNQQVTKKGGVMASKIFVRERRKVEKGEKKPRFRVLGVSGGDLKIYVKHIRKKELDELASSVGAEVVYLEIEKKKTE
jgi:hypothetical protein